MAFVCGSPYSPHCAATHRPVARRSDPPSQRLRRAPRSARSRPADSASPSRRRPSGASSSRSSSARERTGSVRAGGRALRRDRRRPSPRLLAQAHPPGRARRHCQRVADKRSRGRLSRHGAQSSAGPAVYEASLSACRRSSPDHRTTPRATREGQSKSSPRPTGCGGRAEQLAGDRQRRAPVPDAPAQLPVVGVCAPTAPAPNAHASGSPTCFDPLPQTPALARGARRSRKRLSDLKRPPLASRLPIMSPTPSRAPR